MTAKVPNKWKIPPWPADIEAVFKEPVRRLQDFIVQERTNVGQWRNVQTFVAEIEVANQDTAANTQRWMRSASQALPKLDPKVYRLNTEIPRINFKDLDPRLFRLNLDQVFSRYYVYGANLIKNYRMTVASGISPATAAWWALRGTAGFYGIQAAPYVAQAGAMASAGLAAAGKVLGAAAAGFAMGVSLDRAQEAIFGESYTALGVKSFVEQPGIWGPAEAAPQQLIDGFDKYFGWTNYPDQAIGWLKRKLG